MVFDKNNVSKKILSGVRAAVGEAPDDKKFKPSMAENFNAGFLRDVESRINRGSRPITDQLSAGFAKELDGVYQGYSYEVFEERAGRRLMIYDAFPQASNFTGFDDLRLDDVELVRHSSRGYSSQIHYQSDLTYWKVLPEDLKSFITDLLSEAYKDVTYKSIAAGSGHKVVIAFTSEGVLRVAFLSSLLKEIDPVPIFRRYNA